MRKGFSCASFFSFAGLTLFTGMALQSAIIWTIVHGLPALWLRVSLSLSSQQQRPLPWALEQCVTTWDIGLFYPQEVDILPSNTSTQCRWRSHNAWSHQQGLCRRPYRPAQPFSDFLQDALGERRCTELSSGLGKRERNTGECAK